MADRLSELALLDKLTQRLNIVTKSYEFNGQHKLTKLSLFGQDVSEFPLEICQFSQLEALDMRCNRLVSLPPETAQLTRLRELLLDHNQLIQLPPEIGLLQQLTDLSLNFNQLCALPHEIGQLHNLESLWVGNKVNFDILKELSREKRQTYTAYRNQIQVLPPELGNLIKLRLLSLDGNQLTTLPAEIKNLTNLITLNLARNRFATIPIEIGSLLELRSLIFNGQPISSLPSEILQCNNLLILILSLKMPYSPDFFRILNQLPRLETLNLDVGEASQIPSDIRFLGNIKGLTIHAQYTITLPDELWQLRQLEDLRLFMSRLNRLPAELGQLTRLRDLNLRRCRLKQLPHEIGKLTNLQELYLSFNQLTQLPAELGNLTKLETLELGKNPNLLTPPPEVVAKGTAEILAFLRELQGNSVTRYEAKLLVVGEGGTGKSSLLRALREEEFEAESETTHGIELGKLTLQEPESQTTITLNTWDFGGQHIYHATHQFFLTRRSLYLVTWNARLGMEQGRLDYWLDTIKAHAPEAPVLLVATHTDERIPDLNYRLLKDTYPQLAGQRSISNKTGEGLAELKARITKLAAMLPLMGQPWPQKWMQVEQALQTRPEHHIDAQTYRALCTEHHIEEGIAQGTLGDYLHDLGKLLYFRDDYVLSNLVILKPNWITKAISLVLTDDMVGKAHGILQHADLPRIWALDEEGQPYPSYLYPIFLRLMERFDLSYQIEADVPGERPTRSLIPQLLPYQPPIDLPAWPRIPQEGQTQVEMVYHFAFVPPGIMSWFIVRTHRYTRNLHWREGVLLEYQGHQARVELNPRSRQLRLLVWGIQPHNFFTILMNTVDVILARFQGLEVKREIPCICHWGCQKSNRPCAHFYNYEELTRRMSKRRYKVECAQSFSEVSVPTLLYGIHTSTDEQVMEDIRRGQQKIVQHIDDVQDVLLEKLRQQSELLVRNFARQWNLEMQKLEAECPNTFVLTLGSTKRFNPKNWVSQEYKLRLVCQHPPGPHPVGDGYSLREAEEWWIRISPWLNHVIRFLQTGIPLGKSIGAMYDTTGIEQITKQIDLMEAITQHIPEVAKLNTLDDTIAELHMTYEQKVIGPALRALHSFLKQADPQCGWGDLRKTLTPDGNILWLCSEHREQYQAKPLAL